MSEYQYYEFLAVDRPLDARQQAEVRALSTRARITATTFTNEYHWGDFRGDPHRMMERYYDAHLYLANWGTHRVMFRLPRTLLDLDVAERYCVGEQVTAWVSGEHLILDLSSEDESDEWDEGAEDSLSAIVAVRAELGAATCGLSTWPGCRPSAPGSVTRTPSTTPMRTSSSLRCRRGWGR
ncbi:hypothetical protein ACFQX6_26195 [Streptosporangium lutulentum]